MTLLIEISPSVALVLNTNSEADKAALLPILSRCRVAERGYTPDFKTHWKFTDQLPVVSFINLADVVEVENKETPVPTSQAIAEEKEG